MPSLSIIKSAITFIAPEGERIQTIHIELPSAVSAALLEKRDAGHAEAMEARTQMERYMELLESLRGAELWRRMWFPHGDSRDPARLRGQA